MIRYNQVKREQQMKERIIMLEVRFFQDNKTVERLNTIIRSEDLEVTLTPDVETALGDTVVIAYGEIESVETLKNIYECVYR